MPASGGETELDASKQPNLFLLGAMRCGTSILHQTLRSHPDVFMTQPKEPMSLLGDLGRWSGAASPIPGVEPEDYEALYQEVDGQRWRGEASVFYLCCPDVADRILERYPEARFFVSLRDPVERTFSHWRFNRTKDREPLAFPEALDAEDERLEDGWSPYYAYKGNSRYADQLEAWMERFPRERFELLLYDDLAADEDAFFADVFQRLGLDPEPSYVPQQEVSSSKKELLGSPRPLGGLFEGIVPKPILDAVSKLRYVETEQAGVTLEDQPDELLERLAEGFEEDVQAVEELTGRELDGWRR